MDTVAEFVGLIISIDIPAVGIFLSDIFKVVIMVLVNVIVVLILCAVIFQFFYTLWYFHKDRIHRVLKKFKR